LLIEQAERLGEPPEDPLLLFDVLYGFWYANLGASTAMCCATLPPGHRLVGSSSLHTGDFVDSRAHYDQAPSLYEPTSIVRGRLGSVKASECRSCHFGPFGSLNHGSPKNGIPFMGT
jgi:hypothetical protein